RRFTGTPRSRPRRLERAGVLEQLPCGSGEPADVARRHDAAGSELTDRFGDASDVVGDGRNPGSQSLEQRTALVELGAIGEQGDSGLGQGALEVAPGEVAETPLGH